MKAAETCPPRQYFMKGDDRLKRYTAFISSTYKDLRSERSEVIEALMDHSIIPIGMEHFSAPSSGFYEKLKELIDLSDFFILILGGAYGASDKDGVSITKREYLYAKDRKTCHVLLARGYVELLERRKNGEALTDDELKQIAFGEEIFSTQEITEERPISRIITQIVANTDFSLCDGWERQTQKSLREWENKHRIFDLAGTWYHVHLKEEDKDYMRIGTVKITQDFNRSDYRHLYFDAKNYSVSGVDFENRRLKRDSLKKTVWSGEYFIRGDKTIIGVYKTERYFKGKYCEQEIGEVNYWGVHKLRIEDPDDDDDTTDETVMLSGTFNDINPQPAKSGHLYLFRYPEDRFAFLEENFKAVLETKRIEAQHES